MHREPGSPAATPGLHVLLVGAPGPAVDAVAGLAGDPLVVDRVEALDGALHALHDGAYDAVVVDGHDRQALRHLRGVVTDAAVLVLRAGDADLPLDPVDVGGRRTLDPSGMDPRALALSLELAVERHRVDLLLAAAEVGPTRSVLRDPLTGLVTGERLLEDIDRMIADAVRFCRPLTLAVVEVDDLESLEAHVGRAGIDCVEVALAGMVAEGVRTTDLVGRLDRGQLLIAMAGTSAAGAALPVRRMQEAVAAAPPAAASVDRRITVTVGLVQLQGLMAADELVWAAMKAASQAGLATTTTR